MDKEYVKIELGTFYRFVNFLDLLITWADVKKDEEEVLRTMLRDFEREVVEGDSNG